MLALSLLALILLGSVAQSHVTDGYYGNGLIGYGIRMYDPACAYACENTVTGWMLDCEDGETGEHSHGMMDMEAPSPLCYATNDPYLQTLAWCVSTHCEDESMSKLERWWERYAVGNDPSQPKPKYSYQRALALIGNPPTEVVGSEEVLDKVSLVDEYSYLSNYNADYNFENMEIKAETYGLVLLLTCTIIPIGFSLLRFLPFPQTLASKFYAWFIDPPVFGQYHAAPVLGLGFVPTRGQALFIAYIWIMNIVLSAVGYIVVDPMSWYATTDQQLAAYISNRVGLFSFVNLAIAILFSSRNNVLLFITNWSHSTFMLVHRWIAVICALQACLHSAMWLQIYLDMGDGAYTTESKTPYWVWGIIGTLALAVMLPLSVLWIRQRMYELFLSTHIILAVLAMIGCMLHIYERFQWQWGYQNWVVLAFSIWGLDRFLARPLRLLRSGIKGAYVTIIDDDYLKVNIPGAEAEGQVYLYFPTLSWRVWENHPFSVATIHASPSAPISSSASSTENSDSEKSDSKTTIEPSVRAVSDTNITHQPGITFFIRRRAGLTSKLANTATAHKTIPVLIESSYSAEQMSIVPSPRPSPSLEYPNLLCIAGGVGITAILPVLSRATSRSLVKTTYSSTRLYWGVRSASLARSVEDVLGCRSVDRSGGRTTWGNVEVNVSIGERFDLTDVLRREISGSAKEIGNGNKGGTVVLVCGPPGMADEVRNAVGALGRSGMVVRLVVESYFW